MGLPEPVSGSHVASATGSASHYILPPPYCSPSSFITDLTSYSQASPSSIPPPPLSSVPTPDPAPPDASAVVGGPDPASAVSATVDAPDPASPAPVIPRSAPPAPDPEPLLHRSSASGAPPASSTLLPPLSSSSDLASPAAATTVGGPDPAPAPQSGGPSPSVPAPLPHSDPASDGRRHATARLSYAQATRVVKGTGFVRSHAAAVENFAKIPRTGVNIICGSREGIPSFSFVTSDLPKVEELYANALVMKFSGGRPSLEASHSVIQSWGMEHPFSIGPLTSRAFLIRFFDVKDLLKVLTRPSSLLISFPYKVFRWHNMCHLTEDSALAPVWISLPRLPLQCFIPEFLEAIGNKLGRFLCFDKATTTLARPSAARICVELDLRKVPPPSIWIGLFEGFRQEIIYERLPKFCNHCHMMGHSTVVCSKICTEALPSRTGHRKSNISVRPPPARRYAASLTGSFSQADATPLVRPPPARQYASYQPSDISTGGNAPVVPPIISNISVPSHQLNVDPSVINKPIPIAQSHTHEEASNKQQAAPPSLQGIGSSAEPMDKAPPPPPAKSSQNGEQPHSEEQLHPVSEQGLCPGSPSTLSATLSSSHLEASRAAQHPSTAPPLPHPADPAQVHPPILAESQLGSPTRSKTKTRKIKAKKKSVSFKLPGQSNLSANVDFWSAVNNHISNTTSVPPSTCPSDNQKRKIATFDTGKIHPALWEAVNRQASILDQARLTGSPVVQSHHSSSRATVPNPSVSIPSSPNTNLSTMSPSTSDSESSIAADSPPYSPTQISHGAQYDVFSLKPSFYKSEGEDSGTEEARFQGHFSDDMSCAKPKSSRKNKRHPDQPLNVQLRARKGGGY